MKILVAEDDPTSRRLLEALLAKWEFEVISVSQGEAAWEILRQKDAPRMAILDWMMPGMDGVEVCRQVRKRGEAPHIYIIFLTAKGQKSEIVEGLEAGADDYLSKPFDSYELHARLRAGRRMVEMQDQLLAARDALQEEVIHDSVTGLLNRPGALSVLERELARADRMNSTVAVAMIDIDRFKTINDTYGHMAGDAVLREVLRRLVLVPLKLQFIHSSPTAVLIHDCVHIVNEKLAAVTRPFQHPVNPLPARRANILRRRARHAETVGKVAVAAL